MKTKKVEHNHPGVCGSKCADEFAPAAQHTPTPQLKGLLVSKTDDGRWQLIAQRQTDDSDYIVAQTGLGGPYTKANMDFIVRAVNAHEELLALVKEFAELPMFCETPGIAAKDDDFDEMIGRAREAIAKAEGK